MKYQNCGRRKLAVSAGLVMLGSLLAISTSFAQSPENCRAYAEDYSYRYSAPWASLNFGIGGRRAGVSALAANRAHGIEKSKLFDNAYARCMRGRWP